MAEAAFSKRAVQNGLALALILLFVTLDLLSIRHKTVTYDEPSHLYYGLRILEGNSDRFSDSKVPFSALNALAANLESVDSLGSPEEVLSGLSAPRTVTIFFSAVLGWLVFSWSRGLYGFPGGIFSLALYTFCPNLQAHSRWVTTDLYAAAVGAAFLYAFWNFRKRGDAYWGLTSALALGLAPLAKPTLVYLYPAAPLLLLVRLRDRSAAADARRFFKAAAIWTAVFVAVSLAVINGGYLFNGFGDSLNAYQFRSAAFQRVQSAAGPLGETPLPLPKPFLEGLDWTRHNEVTGANRGSNYLLGETRNGPFRWYYLVAYALKVPLGIQILILSAFGFRFAGGGWRREELFLVGPALLYFVLVAFVSSAQLGVRMLLPMFPLLYVFCGSLLEKFQETSLRRRVLVGLLTIWLAVSSLSYYPHYLSYFNELIGDRKNAYRALADSNLDWGQNERYADQYILRHPSTVKNPTVPTAGRIAVSANYLTGVLYPGAAVGLSYADRPDPNLDPNTAWPRWLRRKLAPVDHVAYSYLIFEVSPQQLEEVRKDLEGGDER